MAKIWLNKKINGEYTLATADMLPLGIAFGFKPGWDATEHFYLIDVAHAYRKKWGAK